MASFCAGAAVVAGLGRLWQVWAGRRGFQGEQKAPHPDPLPRAEMRTGEVELLAPLGEGETAGPGLRAYNRAGDPLLHGASPVVGF